MFPDLRQRFFSPDHPEKMDLPDIPPDDLSADLCNLEKLNRHFGGHQATLFILKKAGHGKKIRTVLDCACGAGDLTALISESLPESHITGIDLHPQTLAYAEQKHRNRLIAWQQADIKVLPFPDQSFDLVTCQLALHHFSESDAVVILKELKRVSRGPVFITDLQRSRAAYAGLWIVVRTWMRHPMTRHDALLSVRRAFTESELQKLAEEALWPEVNICPLPWFRQVLWTA